MQDLLGLPVIDEREGLLGRLADVLNLPASDVYVVHGEDGRQWMIPVVDEFVKSVDPAAGEITSAHNRGDGEPVRIDIMTLFPAAVDAMLAASITGRALDRGMLRCTATTYATTLQISRSRWTTTRTAAGRAW